MQPPLTVSGTLDVAHGVGHHVRSRAGPPISGTPSVRPLPPEAALPAPTLLLHADAHDGAGTLVQHTDQNAVDAVYDLAIRLLGDDEGAAHASTEVLLRAIARAADGIDSALTTDGLRRAVVRHCVALRGSGAVTPTQAGVAAVAGPTPDHAIAAAAIASDPVGLVALDLADRHGLGDRAIAEILGARRSDVTAVRSGAVGRLAHDAQLAPGEARTRYAALPHVPAPGHVQAIVLRAAGSHDPAPAPGVRPFAAWLIAAAAVLGVLLLLTVIVQRDGGREPGPVEVAIAVSIEPSSPTAATPAVGLLTMPAETRGSGTTTVDADQAPVDEPAATPTEQVDPVDEPVAEDETDDQSVDEPQEPTQPQPQPQPVPNPLEPLLP